ncbi:Annexin A11 [Escovopsis weberi]|uniref:Annexin A11 n=1 Tax=Escovopsis weberi TaxID=150374 RepID=A0A0M8MYT9_ESCWE|nr:Annexin A11 [Escovopsis weberi]
MPLRGQSAYKYPDEPRDVYHAASPGRDSPYRDSKARDSVRDSETHLLPGAFPEDEPAKDSGDERRRRHQDDFGPPYGKYDKYDKPSREAPRSRPAEPVYDMYDRKYDSRRDDRYGDTHDERDDARYERRDYDDHKPRYPPQNYSRRYEDGVDARKSDRCIQKVRDEDDLAYGENTLLSPDSQASYGFTSFIPSALSDVSRSSKHSHEAEDHPQIRVEEQSGKVVRYDSPRGGHRGSSKSLDISSDRRRYAPSDIEDRHHESSYRDDEGDARFKSRPKSNSLTVQPSGYGRDRSQDRRGDRLAVPPALVVEADRRDRDRVEDSRGPGRDRSPLPSGHRQTLSVDTGRLGALTLASAPPSPMLESYHGTYQQSSPMPSPLIIPARSPVLDDLKSIEALSPLNSDGEASKKLSRRARFHDPEDIASRLAQALKGSHAPKIEPLIEILPSLTHEQVMELRADYKQIVKTGSDRKGVNVAKHIRSRLKDEDPVLMKACYAVALGKWESEAYWANFWYQGDKTRRELLIESLMGRTNDDIHRIKAAFSDKKYDGSLTKCMKTELREDKFKKAVMMVLEGNRMEEYDHHGRLIPIDYNQVDSDVADLRKAIKSEKGGETLMISIVVQRSDSHLRAVLHEYEHVYHANFAREALKKSGNLIGELLAHILNGVINRPVRDALLLNHALTATRKESLRRELLISRLIRFHWDPVHMQEVKRAYRERYGQNLQDAVKEATSAQWGLFCSELCIGRMPDHVRRIERVDRGEAPK